MDNFEAAEGISKLRHAADYLLMGVCHYEGPEVIWHAGDLDAVDMLDALRCSDLKNGIERSPEEFAMHRPSPNFGL